MARTRDFAKIIQAKLAADPDLREAVEEELFNFDLARKFYEARVAAGLSQKQLADRVGTQQSVISRIEDAEYDGRSLRLLRKIASALNLHLRVELSARRKSKAQPQSAIYYQHLVAQNSGELKIAVFMLTRSVRIRERPDHGCTSLIGIIPSKRLFPKGLWPFFEPPRCW